MTDCSALSPVNVIAEQLRPFLSLGDTLHYAQLRSLSQNHGCHGTNGWLLPGLGSAGGGRGGGGGCGRRHWQKLRKNVGKMRKMRQKKCDRKCCFVRMVYAPRNPYVYQDAC